MTAEVAEEFSRLAIATGNGFPEAVEFLRYWLVYVEYPFFIAQLLSESGFCSTHPAASLVLLESVVGPNAQPDNELKECLLAIKNALPDVEGDERYRRLDNQLNRR